MGFYKGIFKKKMKDGSTDIMCRFEHNGIAYSVKNLTKLYGVRTEKQGNIRLGEIKSLLTKGENPFISSDGTLNDLFNKKVEDKLKNKTWKESTSKIRIQTYNKHIKNSIGKRKIEKIKYEDIKNIIDSFTKNQNSTKNNIIYLLKPIFKDAMRSGVITKNILEYVIEDMPKGSRTSQKKIDISLRTHFTHTDIVRRLYKAIGEYKQCRKENIEQHKMFLYMILFTTHRYNEVNLLEKKHCDLKRKLIVAPKEITKSDVDYHYPIPDEVFDYIKNHKGGRLFNVPRGGTSGRIFHRILVSAKIETINNYSLSMHDSRRLMTSIMVSKLNIDSRLADYCLEHKEQKTIKHYLEFTYEDKLKVYKKYWNYIREKENVEEIKEENTIINNSSTLEKVKELVSMLENNYITQEQFEIERNNLYK